jgi:hypothetical protein
MSKIIQAVNLMISNSENITTIMPVPNSRDEYYFAYRGKKAESVWSIKKYVDGYDVAQYCLKIYPEVHDLDMLAATITSEDLPVVTYTTDELKTREARESFSDLYRLINEKHYSVDETLDDIIEGGL